MGAGESVVAPPCSHFGKWTMNEFFDLRREVSNRRFFFGLSTDNLATLLGGSMVLAEKLMGRFNPLWDPAVAYDGAEQPVVNSLALLSMVCVQSAVNEQELTVKQCARFLFELFNWDGSGRLSIDHTAIAALSILRGLEAMTAFAERHGTEPLTDAVGESIAQQVFDLVGKRGTPNADCTPTLMDAVDREEFSFAACAIAAGATSVDEARAMKNWRTVLVSEVELDRVIGNFRDVASTWRPLQA